MLSYYLYQLLNSKLGTFFFKYVCTDFFVSIETINSSLVVGNNYKTVKDDHNFSKAPNFLLSAQRNI